jgi:GNAT superfamily N-acetyltransferase
MQAVPASRASEVAEGLIPRPVTVKPSGRKARSLFERGQLTIRVATPDEASGIATLTRTVFNGRDDFSKAGFDNSDEVERLMARGKFLLAEQDDRIVGFAYLEPRLEASQLDLLAVSPEQQRTGIGSQLLYAAERLSGSMRCFFVHIRVMNLHWETIKFWRRRGYVEFGIEPLQRDQPVSPHCHIVRMCKQLDIDRLVF